MTTVLLLLKGKRRKIGSMKNYTPEELSEIHAFMERVGLPQWKNYEDYVWEWIQKGMTVEEALTQTCDGWDVPCPSRIIHPDAKWRFKVTAIRCPECVKKAMAAGYDRYEATFVC